MPRPKVRTDDLRDHLVATGLEVLLDAGPAAVTARNVATVAGTSTAALYELFGDKAGLVRELFIAGFEQLAARLDALAVTDDPRQDVVAVLAASRAMALETPMLHELMTSRPFAEFDPTEAETDAAVRIYRIIVGRVRRWAVDAEVDPVDAAQVLVAANRGLIASELAGLLGRDAQGCDRRWRLTIHALLDGLPSVARCDGTTP